MEAKRRPVSAIVGAFAVHAPIAHAVDITGTWTICLSGQGVLCPQTFTGVLESTGGQYMLEIADQVLDCLIVGAKLCGTCDDGSPRTADGCGATPCSAPGSACTYGQNNGGSCDDGDPCTVGNFCDGARASASEALQRRGPVHRRFL